ncbi:hypothetical protein ABD86_04090 [Paenibacillus alvei]|uniref:Kelch repeat-containing protein n=1 Tax=Paenibacillus alvei TaxID=44250 RepID=UPI0018CE7191|nr:kelch repeat-containing protein [Paenibacillus alvei]MBG9734563.1 hypothetical protein [Paenibacillus alvei]MBG9743126.1 hypothetical protein [Paenibacillus alvei]MCY9586530.1 cohesin domain-containing protein [Paenibacillus alvei]
MKLKRISLILCALIISMVSFQQMSFAATDMPGWIVKTPMPSERALFASATVNNKIYTIGGRSNSVEKNKDVREYDPINGTWTTKASMPGAKSYFKAAVVDGIIYVVGDSTTSVYAFDPVANTWTTKASIPNAREHLGVVELNGKIYAIGGYDRVNNIESNKVQEYDPITNSWTSKADLIKGRYNASVESYNGKIYVAGGFTKNDVFIKEVEEYDPATNKWTIKTILPSERASASSVVVGNQMFLIGGVDQNFKKINTVDVYNFTKDKWTSIEPLNYPRYGSSAEVVDNKIYVLGGGEGKYVNYIEVYDLSQLNTSDPVLDIESAKDKVYLNEIFTVQAVLKNTEDIYAEDFNIQYDKTKFELVGVQAADHMGLFHNEQVSEDTVRLITASLGKDYGINDKGTLVNLTFKAVGLGIGKVDATKGKIADNGTTEITLTEENCGEKEIEVIGGNFTLKHLGFLGYNYNLDKSNLTDDLQALLGSTGNVVDMDLTELTKAILANPNYDFNN